jgi:hypothetical protein
MICDIQHNYTQHKAEHSYAECLLRFVSFMLSVIQKPFMLSVIRMNVIRLSVVTPLPEDARFKPLTLGSLVQGSLSEGEGSVRLTSLYQLV